MQPIPPARPSNPARLRNLARTLAGAMTCATLFAFGCTTVPDDAGFPDIQKAAAGRLPGATLRWNRNSADDLAADRALGKLLDKPLSADAAVQVALLSNQHLQATYEDLMVAQADLVAAGLLRNPVFDAELKVPLSGSGSMGVELQVVQEFIRVFQIPLRKKLASVAFTAAKMRVTAAVVALSADTRRAYLDALLANAQLENARQTLSNLESCAQHASSRPAAPASLLSSTRSATRAPSAVPDLLRADILQARLTRAEAQLASAQARQRLLATLGLWGRQANRVTLPTALPDLPNSEWTPDSVEHAALANSLELGQARQRILTAASAMGLDNSQINLGLNAERYPDSGHWALGPTIAVPLPLFDNGQAEQASGAAELRRAQALYYARAVELRSAVHLALNDLAAARAAAVFEKQQLLPLQYALAEVSAAGLGAGSPSAVEMDLALRTVGRFSSVRERHLSRLRTYWLARETVGELVAGHMTRTALITVASALSR